MSINYAILGILSCRSLTGYDLKKIIQESSFMYWSGNNNQIYKSLDELLGEGLVTNEIQHQEGSPSKKIYTITLEGQKELKNWVLTSPEPPEFKKTFLIQLAWADQLNTDEWNTLLSGYENEIRMQLLLQQENKRRAAFSPARTSREAFIWEMIHENTLNFHKNEWSWIQKLREELQVHIEESVKMVNYNVIERNNRKYIQCASAEAPIQTEQDALDLITACYEQDTNLVMLHEEALTEEFFKLKTGLAGKVLQKLVNYHIKTAAVITKEQTIKGRAKEMLAESNKGHDFRAFASVAEAENWLLNE